MSTRNIDENLRYEKENLRHEKMQAQIAKIFAEIEKMRKETMLYPLVVGASLIVAGGTAALGAAAIAKLYF